MQFRSIYLALVLCCTAAPLTAGIHLISFDGNRLPFTDRPLVIGTWTGNKNLFRDYDMKADEFQIGFIDYSAINPEYLFSSHMTGEETLSISRSQRFLATLRSSASSIDFNGRVIIAAHGGGTDRPTIGFAHGRGGNESTPISEDARDVATTLQTFFREYNIPVKRIDLAICGNKKGEEMTEAFFDVLKEDFPDLSIVGFKTPVDETEYTDFEGDEENAFVRRVYIEIPMGDKSYSIPASDFYTRGKLPHFEGSKDVILIKTQGTPDPIPETRAVDLEDTGGSDSSSDSDFEILEEPESFQSKKKCTVQ